MAHPSPPRRRGHSDIQGILLRVTLADGHFLGPGKVRLLELVDETGSISAAARAMDMSYRRAWLLVRSMNEGFGVSVLTSVVGGSRGGGAAVTQFGREVIRRYRRMEARTRAAIAADVAALRVNRTRSARR